MIDPVKIKADFPIFKSHPDLVYLDNAATTHKPTSVIRGIKNFYEHDNANIHRGIYDLAAVTTQKYESVRQKVADFIGAPSPQNIVYTYGTTSGINLVAQSFVAPKLNPGDEILISQMEHHANLIPWQMLCQQKKAILKVIPIFEDGTINKAAFTGLLSKRTKILAIAHISNTLGTINPIEEMIEMAHELNIPVLIDGAQSLVHHQVDVQKMDADFFVFSGHKIFGPTGVGILYAKSEFMKRMDPVLYGGDIIKKVTFEQTEFLPPPQRFEAGTTNIAGVIGLGHAIDYLNSIDRQKTKEYLSHLRVYAENKLQEINGLSVVGSTENVGPVLSFTLAGIHPHDIASILGMEKIAIRAGNHCTQPLMDFLKLPGTVRASFSIYNLPQDIDRMANALLSIRKFFK